MLAEERAHLRALIDTIPDLIWLKDAEGKYIACNKRFEKFYGTTESQIKGKTDFDFVPEDLAKFFRENDQLAVEHGGPHTNEELVTYADDGHQELLETTKVPVFNELGNMVGVLGIGHDITAERNAQIELEESKRRYQDLVESTHDWIWEVDAQGVYVYVSPRIENLLGYRQDEIIGKTPFDLMPPDEAQKIGETFSAIAAERKSFNSLININQHRDGHLVVLETSGVPVFGKTGEFLGYRGTDRDVTQRKKNEEALRISEERFELAMRAANDGLWDWDLQTNQVYYSPRWKAMLGYQDDELENSFDTWELLVDSEGKDRTLELIDECMHGEKDGFVIEFRMRHKDGHWVDVLVRSIVIRDENKTPVRMVGTHVDITERKQLENNLERLVHERTAALEDQEERTRLILESSADGLFGVDTSGRFTFINPAACDILGYECDELLGEKAHELTHHTHSDGSKYPAHECSILIAMRDGKLVRRDDEVFWRKNGTSVPVEFVSTPIVKNEAIVGIVVSFRDIEERRTIENALRKSEENLAQAQSIAHLGSWHFDVVSEALNWSKETYRVFGVADSMVIDRNFFESLVYPDDRTTVLRVWERVKQGKHYDIEYRIGDGGQIKWIRERAEQQIDSSGKPYAILGTVQDITEIKEAETATWKALEETQRLAQIRSEFVANMSHEIRTPLNAVLGLSRMGERKTNDSEVHEILTRIRESGEHLLNVVNDVLDFSKIEAGKLVVVSRPFKLSRSINNVMSLVEHQAEEKELQLSSQLADNLSTWYLGDALRLEQILLNLLSNAVKFTESGRVYLSINIRNEHVVFQVEDTGIGMTERQVEELFRPFEQLDSSSTRRFGGTGLGLVISRNLAQLMGGDISVESRLGVGSTFTLFLPLTASRSVLELNQTSNDQAEKRLKGVRILAAEDIEVNRLILADLLEQEGAHVVFAENGQEVLDLMDEKGVSNFDVVLMDIQMPVLDGHAATAKLRELVPAIPVIGLTAHALTDERERCLENGMVDHVAKPIDVDTLVFTIQKHVDVPNVTVTSTRRMGNETNRKSRPGNDMIDWNELSDRFQGRDDFIRKLLTIARDSQADTPSRLDKAISERNFSETAFVAHSIKGMAGNISAGSLQKLAKQTEEKARAEEEESFQFAQDLKENLEHFLAMISTKLQEQDNG